MPIAAPAAEARPRRRLALLGDERLAGLVRQGDQRAFATIYERYHQPLYRYCRSILHNDADAQDAVQTTVVSAFVALQNGRRDAPLRPWLFRIAHNAAISALRRRRPTLDLMENDGPGWGSVEDRVEEGHRLRLLVADLAELPERQRGALVMRELSGLSHEDIAVALGLTVGAAKQAIFEARRALLEIQGGREVPCEQIQRVLSDGDRRVIQGRRMRAHLRDCAVCTAFAEAIPPRREALQMLAPPLAPIAAGGLLARLFGSGHGGGGGAAAGVAAKSTTVALVAKTAATVAVIATATVAVTHVVHINAGPPPAPHRPPALRGTPITAAGATATGAHRTGPAVAVTSHSHGHSTRHGARASGPLAVGRPVKITGTPIGAASVGSLSGSAPSSAGGGGASAGAPASGHHGSTAAATTTTAKTTTSHGRSAQARAKNTAKASSTATATTTATTTTAGASTHAKSVLPHGTGATGQTGPATPATPDRSTPASGATTPSPATPASSSGQGKAKGSS